MTNIIHVCRKSKKLDFLETIKLNKLIKMCYSSLIYISANQTVIILILINIAIQQCNSHTLTNTYTHMHV